MNLNKFFNSKYFWYIVVALIIIMFLLIFVLYSNNDKKNNIDNNIKIEEKTYDLVLKGNEEIIITKGNEYSEPGYYAIDNNNIVTNKINVTDNINTLVIGTYKVIYQYKDIVKIRTVKVIEEEKVEEQEEKEEILDKDLILKLNGNDYISIIIGTKYEELGATAKYKDIDLTNKINIEGEVNINQIGTYTITYTINYEDIEKKITRIVEVKEKLGIEFKYDNSITNSDVSLEINVTGGEFLYLKLPDGILSKSKNIQYIITKNGTYIFEAYDNLGNTVKKTININNIDKQIPTGSCSSKYNYDTNQTTITVNAKDNVGINYYLFNDNNKSSLNIYTFDGKNTSNKVKVYDKAGNVLNINCSNTESIKNNYIEMHFIVSTSDDDAILIRTNSATIMIDGGQYDKNHKVISYLNKIGVKKIDLLIGSHIQYNHVQEQGPIIDTFSVSKAIYSIDIKNCKKNNLCDSNDIKYVLDSINKKNVPVEVKSPGDVMQVGDMKLYFLGPLLPNKKHNKNSFIFILEHNRKKYMFTGDWETDDKKLSDNSKFQEYANKMGITLDVDFFKWPHHGINKVTDAFFSLTKPEYALVPNFHGCSNLKRRSGGDSQMKKLGITYYELCDGVNVVLESDGKTISMKKVSDPSSYYK